MSVDDQHTISLMHFDNGLTDESGKIWTAVGSAAVSTAWEKFGTSSLYIPDSGSTAPYPICTSNFLYGLAEFTIDTWIHPTPFPPINNGSSTNYRLWGTEQLNNNGISCEITPSGINFGSIHGGTIITGSFNFAANTDYHIETGLKNSIGYVFVNGNLIASGAVTIADTSTAEFMIGARVTAADGYPAKFEGYVDEFRVSNILRHNFPFTPSTTAYGSTKLFPQVI